MTPAPPVIRSNLGRWGRVSCPPNVGLKLKTEGDPLRTPRQFHLGLVGFLGRSSGCRLGWAFGDATIHHGCEVAYARRVAGYSIHKERHMARGVLQFDHRTRNAVGPRDLVARLRKPREAVAEGDFGFEAIRVFERHVHDKAARNHTRHSHATVEISPARVTRIGPGAFVRASHLRVGIRSLPAPRAAGLRPRGPVGLRLDAP